MILGSAASAVQAETQSHMTEDSKTADLPPYPGVARWVKVFGIVAIVLVLLVVIVVFTGVGGPHGPRRHLRSGDAVSQTPLSSAANERLAKRLGRDLVELPGGHIGFVTQPVEFAREFVQALAQAKKETE
jgi:hypothetical protein